MVWPIIRHEEQIGDGSTPAMQKRATDAPRRLEHYCELNIYSHASLVRLTSIICTIGPATVPVEMLEKMIDTGMNIARLNFSHGSYEYHGNTIKNIRQAVENYSKAARRPVPIAIALDTKGPEIRTGVLSVGATKEVELTKGQPIRLTVDRKFENACTTQDLYIDYTNAAKVLKPGNNVFISDGNLHLKVNSVDGDTMQCTVVNGGMLGSKKGVNLAGVNVDLPAVSPKDKDDLLFGVEQGVDMVFASFIRNAAGVRSIRKILGSEGSKILIIAKIENHQGMVNIDEILDEADGIMVARGDLGIEIPTEKVFLAQKAIIAKCNKKGKPGICATQMLESMTFMPRPTRAEATDVANAVLDGADCVMLSGESAKGAYPLECVSVMAKICKEAEAAVWNKELFLDLMSGLPEPLNEAHSIAISAVEASSKVQAAAIVVVSESGKTAFLLSKYKPRCPILAVVTDAQLARQCHLHRALIPVLYTGYKINNFMEDIQSKVEHGLYTGLSLGLLRPGEAVVVVTRWVQLPNDKKPPNNTLRIIRVPDDLLSRRSSQSGRRQDILCA